MNWTTTIFPALAAALIEQPVFILLAFLIGLFIGALAVLYAHWRSGPPIRALEWGDGDTHAQLRHGHSRAEPWPDLTWLDPSPHRSHAFEPSQPPATSSAAERRRLRAGRPFVATR